MKKSIIFCLCMAVVVMFTACNKDQDGVFNPAKKIKKIYSVNDGAQQVEEIWHWDSNLLTSIDLYELGTIYNTNTFHYDGNRLTTIRDGYSYATFNYDGKKIDHINVYYNGHDDPIVVYTFAYKGQKLSQIKMEMDYSNIFGKIKSVVNPLKYVLPESCDAVQGMIAQNVSETKAASETITMNFTWSGNNATTVEAIEEYNYDGQLVTVSSLTQCTFDNKVNPTKGFIGTQFGSSNTESFYCNQNNFLTTTTSQNGVVYSSTKMEYEYEDNYPVKITSTTTDNNGDVDVDKRIYEY